MKNTIGIVILILFALLAMVACKGKGNEMATITTNDESDPLELMAENNEDNLESTEETSPTIVNDPYLGKEDRETTSMQDEDIQQNNRQEGEKATRPAFETIERNPMESNDKEMQNPSTSETEAEDIDATQEESEESANGTEGNPFLGSDERE